jgi:hypothetical protein
MIDQRGRWVVGETPILGIWLQWAHLVLRTLMLIPIVLLILAALARNYVFALVAMACAVAFTLLRLLVQYRLRQLCNRGPLWMPSNGVLISALLNSLKIHGYSVSARNLALDPHLKNVVDAYLRMLVSELGNQLKDHIRSGPEMRSYRSFKLPLNELVAARVRKDADRAAMQIASLLRLLRIAKSLKPHIIDS